MTEKVMTLNGAKDTPAATVTEQPVFDFSRTSYKDMRHQQRLAMQTTYLSRRIQNADSSDDITTLLNDLDSLIDQQEAVILRSVVSVPRSWLVMDAPEEIDWQKKDALQWLRGNRFAALVMAQTEASSAKN